MALTVGCNLEVRSDGSDNNGGGCESKRFLHNLVIDASDNTKVTSASYSFVAGDAGADLTIVTEGATGWTRGIYNISSVTAGAAILASSPGAVSTARGSAMLHYGRDYSRQAAAQKSGADLAIHASDSTKVQPVVAGVAAVDIGNFVKITAGTGFTTGVYRITAQDGTYWTLDRSAGTVGSTGGTYAMGGARLTIASAWADAIADNSVWVRLATYNISATLAPTVGGSNYLSRLIGYGTQRGDDGRPTITTNNNAINAINPSQAGWKVVNFIIDGSGSTKGLIGVNNTASYNSLINVKVTGFANEGINNPGYNFSMLGVEVTGCGGTNGAIDCGGNGVRLWNVYCHDNTATGAYNISTQCVITESIFKSNSGASSDGLSSVSYNATIHRTIIYGNGRDGIRWAGGEYLLGGIISSVRNNIIMNNGGYGQNHQTAPGTGVFRNFPSCDYNAYYNNTSGALNNMAHGPHDVILTGDPFVDAAGGDFRLNNTAGAGAACRAAGFPGVLPGLSAVGYADIGVYQHLDAGGAGGGGPRIFRRRP